MKIFSESRGGILRKKVTAVNVLVIISVGLALTFPVLLYGLPRFAVDSTYHATWYTYFAEQLRGGDQYPRWLIDMNEGFGSPVFFFYPPVPYYLTNLLYPFFPNDPHGWHHLGIYVSLSLIASGLCAYSWLRRMVDQNSATVAAIVYMAMPYHLAVVMYQRGAVGEFSSFVWMPLILYFVERIVNGYKTAVVGLAISYALLVATHLPTTLIFSVVPVLYAFFMADGHQRVKVLCITLGGMMLGVGIAAIYLLPAMLTQEFISMQVMRTGWYDYENHFLFTSLHKWKESEARTTLLSLITLTIVGLAGCAFVLTRYNSSAIVKRQGWFWLAVAAASVFMMTPLSKSIWEIFPALQRVQFPFRFGVLPAIATTGLVALGVFSLKRRFTNLMRAVVVVASMILISWLFGTAWAARSATPIAYQNADQINRIRTRDRLVEAGRDAPEYRPIWVRKVAERSQASIREQAGEPKGNLDKVKIVRGSGSASVNRWKARDIVLQVDTPSGAQVTISQFYYPFWTAQLDAEPHRLTVQPSEPDGLLSIWVPSGTHRVALRLERSALERIGQIISGVSAMITLALIAFFSIKRRKLIH